MDKSEPPRKKPKRIFRNKGGKVILGHCEDVLLDPKFRKKYLGKIQLIFTSPPFPLNLKKNMATFREMFI